MYYNSNSNNNNNNNNNFSNYKWNSSCKHAQYWQKNNTKRHCRVCAQIHFNLYREIGVKLDNNTL